MQVILSAVTVQAYRSCKRVGFKINDNLTVLIGPNGSGKTNLLQAIMLLKSAARRRFREPDRDRFALVSSIDAQFKVDNISVPYHATIKMTTDDRNREEIQGMEDTWDLRELSGEKNELKIPGEVLLFALREEGTDSAWRHRMLTMAEMSSRRRISEYERVFKLLSSKTNRDRIAALQRFRSSIGYYGATQFADPTRCPSFIEIDQDGNLRRGYVDRPDHSDFIFSLYRKHKDDNESYEKYLSLVDRRGIGLIQKIYWKEIKAPTNVFRVQYGGRVVRERRVRTIVIPTIRIGSSRLSFNQLSEGTFKTLALLYYLTTDPGSLLLLEEPEVCVHHGLLTSVIEIIKHHSSRKQIIFSTHSDFVLDALKPEDVLLVTNTESNGTTIRPISKAMSAQRYRALKYYLENSGNLGEYWRHSGLDS